MAKKKASSQMERFKGLRRMVLKPLNLLMDRRTYCFQMARGLENFQMVELEKLTLMDALRRKPDEMIVQIKVSYSNS
jgi:hypothetical protein